MSIKKHLPAIVKPFFPQFCDFNRICPFKSKTNTITLAKVFVHSYLNYNYRPNSLFMVFLTTLFIAYTRYETTARVITRTSCFSHITPILQ